jgi:hypothetical protein
MSASRAAAGAALLLAASAGCSPAPVRPVPHVTVDGECEGGPLVNVHVSGFPGPEDGRVAQPRSKGQPWPDDPAHYARLELAAPTGQTAAWPIQVTPAAMDYTFEAAPGRNTVTVRWLFLAPRTVTAVVPEC